MRPMFLQPYALAALLIWAGSGSPVMAQTAAPKAAETPKPAQTPSDPDMPDWLKEERGKSLENAALAPLNDLNLRKANIPEILIEAVKSPYNLDGLTTCSALGTEIVALDQVLGQDFDGQTVPAADGSTLSQKGQRLAGDTAVGAVRSTSTSIIPFRGIMRKVTGAEHHEREVDTAIEAGSVRRAYLKGVGVTKNCAPPAAPAWFTPEPVAKSPAKSKVNRSSAAKAKP